MARSVLLLFAGAMAGGTTVYVLGSSPSREGESPSPIATNEPLPLPPVPAAANTVVAGGYAAERLAIFEQVAVVADSFEIEALIDDTLDELPSRLRELKLNALLQRLAEIDPRGAIEFARTRYFEPTRLVSLFEIWAQADPDAAIAELAFTTPPGRRREVALAILAVIGNDRDGIERVAAALPAADRISFETDAMLLRAETDPRGALRDLLAMPDYYRRTMMLSHVAAIAALADPRGALEESAAIDEYALRRSFRESVLSAWAAQDPEAVYAWIEAAEIRDLPQSAGVYQALARQDPDRLFAMLEGLPPAVQTNAKRAAMQVLAETDPNAAIAQLQSMPQGQERDNLLSTIGQAYGRQNPELALAWVRSLPPPQNQTVMRTVVQGIMAVDPERAVEIVIAELEAAGRGGAAAGAPPLTVASQLTSVMSVSMLMGNSQVDFGRVADRLLAVNNPQVASMMSSMIGNWARQSPDEALQWALGNVERLDRNAFGQMAQAIAQADPERALNMLNQVPPAQRPEWLAGATQQMARNDPNRAVELVASYRGQPEYGAALTAVVSGLAQNDPARAAALLRDAPPGATSSRGSAYLTVASSWSRTDPEAAAAWATEIPSPQERRTALSMVSQQWAQRDPAGAERWVRGMPAGETRDAAAGAFVSSTAQSGRFDPALLDLFSSEQAAESAAANAIRNIGRTNAPEARRLLEVHITDERLRQSVEDYLARSGGAGSPTISTSGLIF